ncbi:hypothetical protein GLOIN_2v1781474 [Rhizophagus clarus]|nr:hypothetical protein GLOIN_2v1781474 [Rhizophagus clarus]
MRGDKASYLGFLKNHRDIIITSINTSTFSDDWNKLDCLWIARFLYEGKDFSGLKDKVEAEHMRSKMLPIFWKEIIKECEKENNKLSTTTSITSLKRTAKFPAKSSSKNSSKDSSKDLTNFCYHILHELENKSNIEPFYRFTKKSNKVIRNPMDLFIISAKLDNDEYTNIKEFEKDMHLIFRNCYTYNDKDSKIYHLGEELESVFIEIWAEKTQKEELKRIQNNDINFTNKIKALGEKNINQQKVELKRIRDNDIDLSSIDRVAKQIRILEGQNKDDLVSRDVFDNAFHIALAYKNLVTGNIIPFIRILKSSLLSRSQMSLSSANEPVLQAIVERLLPQTYHIPELSLVMDGKKQKGFGRFGYLDIFVVKGIGDNNISLELKYISLVGLIKNQKDKYGANDLEDLDKILEKEDEELLLKKSYSYWSKEHNKTDQITISEVLENGIIQLRSYMNIIAKGRTTKFSSSGIFDKRVKITKSNPNELKGFVILVIGFRRILWRPVKEVISNYSYVKV